MKKSVSIILFILLVTYLIMANQEETQVSNISPKFVTFNSSDQLEISADLYYYHDPEVPFIILFHQAGWSRGEYMEIAPKLVRMGFNCLAIDQRSGESINGVVNLTANKAIQAQLPTTYLHAYPDMEAALLYVKANYAHGKLILWGSSYSSSLILKLGSEHSDKVDGILAFSPGEYFQQFDKNADYIETFAANIQCPVFITSAPNEKESWQKIYQNIDKKYRHYFIPETTGNHGSKALWEKFDDNPIYWKAVENFLTQYYKRNSQL